MIYENACIDCLIFNDGKKIFKKLFQKRYIKKKKELGHHILL